MLVETKAKVGVFSIALGAYLNLKLNTMRSRKHFLTLSR